MNGFGNRPGKDDQVQVEHIIIGWLSVFVVRLVWHRTKIKWWLKRTQDGLLRRWRAKSPHDCPSCRSGVRFESPVIQWKVTPYAQCKSKRGRKKRIASQGYACPNGACAYFGIIDAAVHALVSHGKRGKGHDIQYFKCQACQKTFTCRRGTPLYYLKTDVKRIEFVLWFLAEGVDRSVLIRYTGHADATLARWLMRAGDHSQLLHNQFFRGLSLALIQMDELYAPVRSTDKARWVWLAIDPISKALPALHLGSRQAQSAYALLHDLHLRLADDCVPAFTTDGLRSYFYAITAHFGSWWRPPRARTDHWQPAPALLHGQLIKRNRGRQLAFTVTRMTHGKRRHLLAFLKRYGFNPTIQTAFIERVNLTIRQCISLLTRRTWSTARSDTYLLAHLEWWRAYYHFGRPHQALRVPIPGFRHKFQPRTPAMALGLTDHVWSVADILHQPFITAPVLSSVPT